MFVRNIIGSHKNFSKHTIGNDGEMIFTTELADVGTPCPEVRTGELTEFFSI